MEERGLLDLPWQDGDSWPFRWVPRLATKLRENDVKPLETSQILISSDYSGTHKNSRFFLVGILIADADHLLSWQEKRIIVRQRFLRDGRRMAFKNLNDGNRRAALPYFLDAADEISGLSIVIAIDKRISDFGSFEGFYKGLKERDIVTGNWKPESFKKMIAVTHIMSILLGIVTRVGQDITWISDADELFATNLHRQDVVRMMGAFCNMYVKHSLGQLFIGTTELDEGDRFEEDFTAIPDIAAGAIGELFNRICLDFGKIPNLSFLGPKNLSKKSDAITTWFFNPNKSLHKLACSIQKVSEGHFQIGVLNGS